MKRILFVIFLFSSALLFAQKQSLDTSLIRIGEQTKISINCNFEKKESFVWPSFNDTLITGIEIIDEGEIDSLENEELLTISQNFIITAFDSGTYFIPPIIFNDNKKTEGLILNVQTVELAEDSQLMDIKPPMEVPYGWSDIWPWLLGILIITLIIYLLKKYVFTKKKKDEKIKPRVVIPSDIIALNELAILKNKELWKNGKLKQYHSEISEILRTYLEDRFQILALELPTYDILQNLKNKNLQKENLTMLSAILQRADLAKYAKSKPTDSENTESMDLSVNFVKNTKVKEVENG
jgi:hypothetical protein|tara:strand:- start:317 stop:1201 length:885 start_codon:yes stop_codon:yes gene_type:complete